MSTQMSNANTHAVNWRCSLSYRSKATCRPTAGDLRELAWKAREKNRALGVKGMLLYNKGHFFQTLEGPPAQIEVLWQAISTDNRHSDIEILSEHVIPAGLFGNWDLLAYHGDEEPHATVQQAQAQHGVTRRVPELLELVLNGDDIGINTLITTLAAEGWDGDAVITHLLEPAARALGNAWLSDDCSELELTIGLSMLQLAGHAVRHNPTSDTLRNSRYSILVASAPGEPHTLGTSLLADLFTDAGWHVDMAFPDSNQALVNQLAAQQPDAVDIGLSEALPREHTLANLRKTIERSRFAAPDQLTVVSVGGRLFADALASAENVGADHARKTVAGTTIQIAELIRQKRQEPRRR